MAAIIHNTGTARESVQHRRFTAINTLLGNLKMRMNTTFRGFETGYYAMRDMAISSAVSIAALTWPGSCRTCWPPAISSIRLPKQPSEPRCRLSLVPNRDGKCGMRTQPDLNVQRTQ